MAIRHPHLSREINAAADEHHASLLHGKDVERLVRHRLPPDEGPCPPELAGFPKPNAFGLYKTSEVLAWMRRMAGSPLDEEDDAAMREFNTGRPQRLRRLLGR
jgi:hypothetical protein